MLSSSPMGSTPTSGRACGSKQLRSCNETRRSAEASLAILDRRTAPRSGGRWPEREGCDGPDKGVAQGVVGLMLFCGSAGVAVTKSEALSPVSMQLPSMLPGRRWKLTSASPTPAASLCGRLSAGAPSQT